MSAIDRFAAFLADERLAAGDAASVLSTCFDELSRDPQAPLALYRERDGRRLDLDPASGLDAALAELAPAAETPAPRQGPGRPALGVVAREVTLLPRHWEWLGAQRGGASAALRRLVDEARKARVAREDARQAREALHRLLWNAVGDQPGTEAACRALDSGNAAGFADASAAWPPALGQWLRRLATELDGKRALAREEAERHGESTVGL